jgi:hypothetical protein
VQQCHLLLLRLVRYGMILLVVQCAYICLALPCERSSVVTEEEKKEKLIVEGFVR